MMLTPDLLHDYQKRAVDFQCTHPQSMLWLDMGLGKTIVTLTSIAHLINANFLKGVLIVAPIRVIRLVWKQEAAKWQHTKHLKFSMVAGVKDQRTRALMRPADVYLINYENLQWLSETLETYYIKKNRLLPFNGVVWDEVSKMKNSTTNRVSAVSKILNQFVWATGLTGTPASNGFKDLHGQYLVVDRGQRLGVSKTKFMTEWYRKAAEDSRKFIPYKDTEERIKQLIGDITLEMSAEDYNKLPDLIMNNVEIDMPDMMRAKYDQMEREFFLKLDSGTEVEMFNKAALTNKCLQFSNGAMYPVAGMPLWEPIHDYKLDALEEIIDEANGSPVLCSYAYRSDAERIMTRFKHLNPINLTDCKSQASLEHAMTRWQLGECPLMIGHPACLAADTQVLTERSGWVNITDVRPDDRVHDGIEFVCHDGCSYSGFKDVIEVFGIHMTPNHKLLIDNQWVEAKNVPNLADSRNKAVVFREDIESRTGSMFDMWKRASNDSSKCNQEQQRKSTTLRSMHIGHISLHDQHTHLENLARTQKPNQGHIRQKLWRSRDWVVSRMVEFCQVLRGHVRRLCGSFDNRTNRRKWAVQQNQLSMGYQHGAAIQQTNQSTCSVSGEYYAFSRVVPSIRVQQDNAAHAIKSRNDRRRSSSGLHKLWLRKESVDSEPAQTRKTHVYDLVNCGPRHRFLIRNAKGEVFISHNSMGHGVDGLQKTGHTLVWFGLNWSLDLYEQFNARLRRQGQGVPVICHRILMRDTLDQAQAMALDAKASTQASLRNAIKQYRLAKEKR